MEVIIRKENKKDYIKVCDVVKVAFESSEITDHNEHNLVKKLRKSHAFVPELSLIAEVDGEIVGHIMFTKIKVGESTLLALAPLSIMPEYQGRGIGGMLTLEGHKIAKSLGYKGVVVLGHHDYYPRFGYVTASSLGVKSPFEVPDEVFMALELSNGSLNRVNGIVQYAKEFFE